MALTSGPGAWVMLSGFTCWHPWPCCMCQAPRTRCWSLACWIHPAGIPGWPCCMCHAPGMGAMRAGSIQRSPAREPCTQEQKQDLAALGCRCCCAVAASSCRA